MARNLRSRRLVTVTVSAQLPSLRYGFRSGLRDSERSRFGQTPVDNPDNVTGLVVGANAPKPARAAKKIATGWEGSYCSHSVIAALKTAGYKITSGKPTRKPRAANQTSRVVYVTVNGIKYAWYSPSSTVAANISTVGIRDASPSDNDLIFGAEFPKPPRYKIIVGDDSFSSFIDPSNADQAASSNWFPVDDGNFSSVDLARYL